MIREGFSEEVACELRLEGQERTGCSESMGKRILGRGNSSCTGPSSGGINKPRVFEERQRGLSGQGGVNRGRREADGAEQGGKSPGQASWAQKGHADQLRVNGKPLEGFSRAMTQPEI